VSNKNLDIWEDIFQNNEWGKYPPVALIRMIARNFYKVKSRESVRILELGSGTGANLWYMAREGFTVYGIDGSKTACDYALNRLDSEKLSNRLGSIQVGDYFDKLHEFEDEYFDAIIDVESLYCNSFDKTRVILELAMSKLKPEGKLFSLSFSEGTWGLVGDEVNYHAVMPTEGPMAKKGFSRYMTRDDVINLYKFDNNEIKSIEIQELHLDNHEVIKEWIIEVWKN